MTWHRRRRRFRDPFLSGAMLVAARLVGWLPLRRLPMVARRAGAVLGWWPRARRLVRANLQTAFPEWPPERTAATASQVYYHIALTALEFLWFHRHPDRLTSTMINYQPAAAAALARAAAGQSMLFLTPHLGNWEISAQATCLHGVKLAVVARRIRSQRLNRMIQANRAARGIQLIPEKGAVRELLKALRTGCTLGILMDQNVRLRRGGILVDFFGLPVPTTRAPAALARKTGVEVVCFACVRGASGLELHARQLPKPVAEYSSDEELTQDMLTLNEAFIRQFPEQYMWFYERWRYIPADTAPELRVRFPFYAKPIT